MIEVKVHQTVRLGLSYRKAPLTAEIRDYGFEGLWLMQKPSVLSDCGSCHHSGCSEQPLLHDGDTVWCKGAEHRVKVIGDYSDAGKLVLLNY